VLLCAPSGNHDVVAGTGVMQAPGNAPADHRFDRPTVGTTSAITTPKPSASPDSESCFATRSAVLPRAVDGCIARMMRKPNRARPAAEADDGTVATARSADVRLLLDLAPVIPIDRVKEAA
jgi:hypothetical protein